MKTKCQASGGGCATKAVHGDLCHRGPIMEGRNRKLRRLDVWLKVVIVALLGLVAVTLLLVGQEGSVALTP